MDSNKASRPIPPRRRAAWAASAVALGLAAGGGWLLSRPTQGPEPTAGAPASSAPGAPVSPHIAAKAETAAAPLPAAPLPAARLPAAPTSAPAQPALPVPISSVDDALRKVRLALEGRATPKEMLEVANLLSACPHADMAVQAAYAMRDQPNPALQHLEKRGGYSIPRDRHIELAQDMQRRCQAFDAATLARRGELFKGAYEGGAEGAALPYLSWLSGDGKQEANPELIAKLKREAREAAESGDYFALLQHSFPFSTATYGITEVQRQAYKEAQLRIAGETGGAEFEKLRRASVDEFEKKMAQWTAPPPPLSPEQQREADALAAKVVEAWRKRRGQGG